jgi:hypothetical protein
VAHGTSYSEKAPLGTRRKAKDSSGKIRVLAPRSLRKHGKHYMSDCTQEDIAVSVLGISKDTFRLAQKEIQEGVPSDRSQKIMDSINKFMEAE